MGKTPEIYPFFKANIHEQRLIVSIFRCLPLAIFILVAFLLVYGAIENERLLLAVCAVLNPAMWIWIVTTCLFGILGSWKVQAELDAKDSRVAELPAPVQAVSDSDNEGVVHLIVLPNYKEDENMLAETLSCLTQAADSKSFHVCLAMEEREGEEGGQKAQRLQQRFKDEFADVFVSMHPADLQQEHLDNSVDLEVPGKASNLKYAVQKAVEHVQACPKLSIGNVLLTVADADCFFHPCYFSNITQDFNMLREGPGAAHQWCMWQAPQLSFRDHWIAPVCSRIWTYVSGMYEFSCTSSLHWNGFHMVFSGYTLPLQLARDAESWDGDVIAEDHHAYLKNLLYSAHTSATDACSDPRISYGGCEPMLEVRPVFLPVKSTPVISGESYCQSWVERWHQAKRHAQGVAELPFAMLGCWDICCTLPLHQWSFSLAYKLFRSVVRLFCMHVLPLIQGLALGIITGYWLYKKIFDSEIASCPHTMSIFDKRVRFGEYTLCFFAGAWTFVWPLIVPMVFVSIANFAFLEVTCLRPVKAAYADRFAWYKSDGDIPEEGCCPRRVKGFFLVLADCVVLLGPVMILYGLFPLLLAYWQVCFYGNRFKYITAAKAVKTTGAYGTMSTNA